MLLSKMAAELMIKNNIKGKNSPFS